MWNVKDNNYKIEYFCAMVIDCVVGWLAGWLNGRATTTAFSFDRGCRIHCAHRRLLFSVCISPATHSDNSDHISHLLLVIFRLISIFVQHFSLSRVRSLSLPTILLQKHFSFMSIYKHICFRIYQPINALSNKIFFFASCRFCFFLYRNFKRQIKLHDIWNEWNVR